VQSGGLAHVAAPDRERDSEVRRRGGAVRSEPSHIALGTSPEPAFRHLAAHAPRRWLQRYWVQRPAPDCTTHASKDVLNVVSASHP